MNAQESLYKNEKYPPSFNWQRIKEGDTMDWEPATNQLRNEKPSIQKNKQAKWVSHNVLRQRRQKEPCGRCGGGHFVRTYPYLPPARTKKPNDNMAQFKPLLETTEIEEPMKVQGNEKSLEEAWKTQEPKMFAETPKK